MAKEDEFQKLVNGKFADEKYEPKERTEVGAFAKKNKISNLNANLAYARAAVAFVQMKIPVASNFDLYAQGSFDNHYLTTGNIDPSKAGPEEKCVLGDVRYNDNWRQASNTSSGPRTQRLNNIQTINGLARKYGCGNCKEQAAVAFTFLHRLGIRPLDYVSLTPYSRTVDHVFVVIGREYDYDSRLKTEPWEQWGDDAVICDAWSPRLRRPTGSSPMSGQPFGDAFGAYPAKQLREKMKQLFPAFSGVAVEHGES